MSESAFKAKVRKQLEEAGWYVIHLIQTNKNGIPDTLCMKDGKQPFFIEFKAKGKKPRPLQAYRHLEIKMITGCDVKVMTEP